MRNFLKAKLSISIWDYLRFLKSRIFRRGRFALNGLDKKLERYLNYSNGFFVELGANDGFTQSNTLHLELKRGWRGVLVEPSPLMIPSLHYFRQKPGNSIFCYACVPFDYKEKYVDIEYAGLMTLSSNLKLDIEFKSTHLDLGRSTLAGKPLAFGALARPLSFVLDESAAPREVDLLSLDVEGAELEVLRGLDFDKYRFKFMLIECRDLPKIEEYLLEKGYALVEQLSHHDYLFSATRSKDSDRSV